MNSLKGLYKTAFSVTAFLFLSYANVSASNIEPPFGIRNYDVGMAPNFTLQDIDGEDVSLSNSKGHWVFLHFWASWCGPCREEMPTIQSLASTFKNDQLEIIMINTAEDDDTIFEFLGSIEVDLTSLMDADGLVTEVWKPRGLPTSFLINPKGEIKYQAIGGREWDKPLYTDFIKKLISRSNSKPN